MTSDSAQTDIPADAKPGDILTPDGQILWRDGALHAFGYFSVTYAQAQVARAHGWGCRSGLVLEAEHSDARGWAHAEEERQEAIANGDAPPLVRIYREAPPACALDTPPSCRMPRR